MQLQADDDDDDKRLQQEPKIMTNSTQDDDDSDGALLFGRIMAMKLPPCWHESKDQKESLSSFRGISRDPYSLSALA